MFREPTIYERFPIASAKQLSQHQAEHFTNSTLMHGSVDKAFDGIPNTIVPETDIPLFAQKHTRFELLGKYLKHNWPVIISVAGLAFVGGYLYYHYQVLSSLTEKKRKRFKIPIDDVIVTPRKRPRFKIIPLE